MIQVGDTYKSSYSDVEFVVKRIIHDCMCINEYRDNINGPKKHFHIVSLEVGCSPRNGYSGHNWYEYSNGIIQSIYSNDQLFILKKSEKKQDLNVQLTLF